MRLNRSHLALFALAGLLGGLALRAPAPPPATPPVIKPAPLAPAPAPAKKSELLLFTQAVCPPCRVIEASLKDPSVKSYLDAHFSLSEVSWPDSRFHEYGVHETPTLIAVVPSGNKTRVGAASPEGLLSWLKSLESAGESRPIRPGSGSGKIVEAGYDGPGGRRVMIDFPPEWWKANVTSRGQGCCVFRSIDFAAHWQNVPPLWAFPEWLQSKGLPGGGYSENVTSRIAHICQERHVTEPAVVNVESQDYELLKLVLATGRLACVDYSGADGVHYGGRIAHCVCLSYVDDDYVAILDNNFPPDKLLWMPASEFKQRWGGWIIALCAPRPPASPHN